MAKKNTKTPTIEGTYLVSKSAEMPGGISVWVNKENLNWEQLQLIKSMQRKEYENCIELPITSLSSIVEKQKHTSLNIDIPTKQPIQDNPLPSCVKSNLFDYQKYGVDYAISKKCFILGDDLGLGKTLQTITYACWLKERGLIEHCLVICCVGILKFNWCEEIEKHTNLTCRILGQYRSRTGKVTIRGIKDRIKDLKEKLDEFFIITNIETLRDSEVQKAIKTGPNKFDMVVVDEIHKSNNPSSKQGNALLSLFKNTPYVVPISGTLSPHRPENCYIPLKLIREETCGWTNFKRFYVVTNEFAYNSVAGYKNLDILRNQLEGCMLRRKKDTVLSLPPKLWKNEYLELDSSQNILYEQILSGIKENIDVTKDINVMNVAAQIIRLRQVTGCPQVLTSLPVSNVKMDRMEQLVDEIVYNGHKCVVVSNWTSVTDEVLKRLSRYNTVEITGKINDAKKQINKQKFQQDDSIKVCVGTHGSMGVGITLTAADYIIFIDEPWSQADKTQVEDRIHRIGTKSNVTIITLICKNTIDEDIHELVYKKGLLLDFLNGDISKMQYTNELKELLTRVLGR